MGGPKTYQFDTLSLHAGQQPDPQFGARAQPVYFTTSYVFKDTDHAASLFNMERAGHVYTRISNPTNAVLEERISVVPRHGGEKVEIVLHNRHPHLQVSLGAGLDCQFQLTLTRYEYLSRVAEGAMPNSFSKECFEDLLALKGRLMRELAIRDRGVTPKGEIVFRVLDVDGGGAAREERIGVRT